MRPGFPHGKAIGGAPPVHHRNLSEQKEENAHKNNVRFQCHNAKIIQCEYPKSD